ncbi:MAG TPA: hypothetical protein VIK01_15775 [Polyangiaceae bacterium]
MSPFDVGDELTGFGRSPGEPWAGSALPIEDQKLAQLAFGSLVARMRLGEEGEPLTPAEVARVLGIVTTIGAAVVAARDRRRLRLLPARQKKESDDG